jgi:hypothetical protein
MRRLEIAVLLGFILWAAGASADEGRPTITNLGGLRFQVDLSLGSVEIGEVEIEGATYSTFSFPGASHVGGEAYIGQPDLPYLDLWTLLPSHMQIREVDLISSTVVALQGDFVPAPVQPPFNPQSPQPAAVPDPQIYGSLTPWPDSPGQLGYDGNMRGYFIGRSKVFPIRYTGSTQTIEVLTQLVVQVEVEPYDVATRGPVVERSPIRPRHSLHGEELKWIRRMVANADALPAPSPSGGQGVGGEDEATPYGGFNPADKPSDGGPPVMCVIITDSTTVTGVDVGDIVSEFQRLADWKTEKGVPTVVRTVKWIRENYNGHDIAEQIREFVIDGFENWGVDYVILGGDIEIVPESGIELTSNQGDYPHDALYGFLDGSGSEGDDAFWDAWVGRLPADNADDARSIVSKLLTYELKPGMGTASPDSTYYTNLLALTGPVNSAAVDDSTKKWGCGYYVSELICRSMAIPAGMSVDRLYGAITDTDSTCNIALKEFLYIDIEAQEFQDWTVGAAQDSLESKSYGIIYHYEHSTAEFLGGPSRCTYCPASQQCDFPSAGYGTSITTEFVDGLNNGPEYAVVWSSGSVVNGFDIDCISEHWLNNPNGGAVAFLGKPRPYSPGPGKVDSLFFENVFQHGVYRVGAAFGLATQSYDSETEGTSSARHWGLLGDPEMSIWTSAPGTLAFDVEPDSLVSIVPVRITVSVQDSVSTSGVDSALVALKQGTEAYAYTLTDASGVAEFDFWPVSLSTDIVLTVTADNYAPARDTVYCGTWGEEDNPPVIVYDSHTATGYTHNGSNGMEAGETWDLSVTVENISETNASDVLGTLVPQGPLTFDLEINGSYDPDRIHIGRFGSHPPVFSADTLFTLPELLWHGVNPNGCPTVFDSSNAWGYFVWRDTTAAGNDWRLVCRGEDSPTTDVFTGSVFTLGEFSDVQDYGFEAGDSLSWSASTSTFSFADSATSADEDSVLFSAHEVQWISVIDSTVSYGAVATGASASGGGDVFRIGFDAEVPDEHTVILALDAAISYAVGGGSEQSTTSSSMFMLPLKAPVLAQRMQDRIDRPLARPPRIDLAPFVRNSGLGSADSVYARISQSTSSGVNVTFSVDQLYLGRIPADSTRTPGAYFQFTLADTDTCDVRLDLELVNYFLNGDSLVVSKEGIDICRPGQPTILSLYPTPEGVMVSWEEPDTLAADIQGYNVYSDSALAHAELLEGEASAFVSDLAEETGYNFVVTAQDSSGNVSPWPSDNVPQATTAQLADGWPKRIDGGTKGNMGPTVADVDGDGTYEVFVGSIDVFAWNLEDGTEFIDGDNDSTTVGVFFATSDSLPDGEPVFYAPFAIADLDSTPSGLNKEIVGVITYPTDDITDFGTWLCVWNADGTERWRSFISYTPVKEYNAPSVADLNEDGYKEIVLLHDVHVWAWNYDGSSYGGGSNARFVPNLLAGEGFRSTAALGDVDPDSTGLEIVVGRPDSAITVLSSTVGTELWTWHANPTNYDAADSVWVPGLFAASSPVLGDVDGDEDLEIIVAMGSPERSDTPSASDSVFVLDYDERVVMAGWSTWYGDYVQYSFDRTFRQLRLATDGHYVSPPAVGEVDGGDGVEILLVGKQLIDEDKDRTTRAWLLDLEADTLAVITMIDSIPRRHYSQVYGEKHEAAAQPLIGDLDGNDQRKEVLWVTTHGGHFAADPNEASPILGWPITVNEAIYGSAAIGDFTDRDKVDLVSLTHDGSLHLYSLSVESTGDMDWGQFGGNAAHTLTYPIVGSKDWTSPSRSGALVTMLGANVPNPFNPSTAIHYAIGRRASVTLKIYDVSGRLVRTLVDGIVDRGVYRALWDGRDHGGRRLCSGVYFYRLRVDDVSTSRKMLLLR